VTKLRAGRTGVLSPAAARNFLFCKNFQTDTMGSMKEAFREGGNEINDN